MDKNNRAFYPTSTIGALIVQTKSNRWFDSDTPFWFGITSNLAAALSFGIFNHRAWLNSPH